MERVPELEVTEPRAGFGPATTALPRRCPTRLGHRGVRVSVNMVNLCIKSLRFFPAYGAVKNYWQTRNMLSRIDPAAQSLHSVETYAF
jgi:hypothetical protein